MASSVILNISGLSAETMASFLKRQTSDLFCISWVDRVYMGKWEKWEKLFPLISTNPAFYSTFLLLFKIYYHHFQYKCSTPLFKLMGRWAGWYLISQSISGYEASTNSFGCHLMTVYGIPAQGSMMMRSHCTAATTCSLFHLWQDGINPHIWLLICFQNWKWFWTSR